MPDSESYRNAEKSLALRTAGQHVEPEEMAAAGGRPPLFSERTAAPVHDRVRKEMLRIYPGTELPRHLDATARELLGGGEGELLSLSNARASADSGRPSHALLPLDWRSADGHPVVVGWRAA